MRKRRHYKQGIFHPINEDKYRGSRPIIFRSGLELEFCKWCDKNENVLQWGSESVVIPYKSPKDGRMHRYFTDGVLKLKTEKGSKNFLVEIKPDRQTRPPKTIGRKSKKNLLYEQVTYAVNCCKWEAAQKWCEKNGFEFVILTEKHIK
jgi:hypothetical protein